MEGVLQEKSALRFTPAGIPVIECEILHSSEQQEAGSLRKVDCSFSGIALGEITKALNAANLGALCKFTGFLAPKSLRQHKLKLHITDLQFL